MRKILVTGVAGFIGSNFCRKILESTDIQIIGIDNFDDFYSKHIKLYNLRKLQSFDKFIFIEADINYLNDSYSKISDCDCILHFAAKAGVRPSLSNPVLYSDTNITGTVSLLDIAVKLNIPKFIFASSSSIYGINQNIPWSENAESKPISAYAVSKLCAEEYGKYYSQLYGIQFIALRFFTVYGPGQRPDLAIHKFFKKIYNNEIIDVYGKGDTFRDYTFIDDIVDGITKSMHYDTNKFEVFNLGNNDCISLNKLISLIEVIADRKARLNYLSEQLGDVPKTYADITKAKELIGYSPSTSIEQGLTVFNKWYKDFYGQ